MREINFTAPRAEEVKTEDAEVQLKRLELKDADGSKNEGLTDARKGYFQALSKLNEEPNKDNAIKLSNAALEFAQELQGADLDEASKKDLMDKLQNSIDDAYKPKRSIFSRLPIIDIYFDFKDMSIGGVLRHTVRILDNPEFLTNLENIEKMEDAADQLKSGTITASDFKFFAGAYPIETNVRWDNVRFDMSRRANDYLSAVDREIKLFIESMDTETNQAHEFSGTDPL